MMCSSRLKGFAACFLVGMFLCAVSFQVSVQAQVAGGTITGTLVDNTERVLPNASVSMTNVATGITRIVNTNEDGLYIAPNLLPATYELTFAAVGFKTEVRRGIDLTVGATVTLNMLSRYQPQWPDVSQSDLSSTCGALTS